MRVLVYPHDLGMGGSQTNAVEIASHLRTLGVESVMFGRPGALEKRIAELGLELVESPDPGRRPSLRTAALLRDLARRRRIDILHGYEWPPSLECAAAAGTLRRTVAVSTVMSMSVPPFIPTTVPLVVGTHQIASAEHDHGRAGTSVIEPPVDLDHNQPCSARQVAEFRQRWSLDPGRTLVVCVGRLADELKSEGLLAVIEALGSELPTGPAQLLVVGDGPARGRIDKAARALNELRPGSVVLTGQLDDPRPAYSAADVVLAMGGSALRTLALGKPLIVQGERGYFEVFDERSWPTFAWQGFYGVGAGSGPGPARFVDCLTRVLADPTATEAATRFGRALVRERFSLEAAARAQLAVYEHALTSRPAPVQQAAGMLAAGYGFTRHTVGRKVRRRLGVAPSDDFNARPVAALAAGAGTDPGAVVYLSGSSWHAVAGSDVALASALAGTRPVVWVDPPMSVVARRRSGVTVPLVSHPVPGLTRIQPAAPPGATRPGVRTISRLAGLMTTRAYLWASATPVTAVIASSPEPLLQDWGRPGIRRVYYATDDFVAGSSLLGISASRAVAARRNNLDSADLVLAVSEALARELRATRAETVVFPNGCSPERYRGAAPDAHLPPILSPPLIGLVGQLNERLDLAPLLELADRGHHVLLVGPRHHRDPGFGHLLDTLIARDNVQWIDRRPVSDLPAVMARLSVGLTTYTDTAFNRASSPLKTLDYLAAGVPVVSTDLPASRGLDPHVVRVASSPTTFADQVEQLLAGLPDTGLAARCRSEADRYSWAARAEQLNELVGRP